jgi:hypothetical protein
VIVFCGVVPEGLWCISTWASVIQEMVAANASSELLEGEKVIIISHIGVFPKPKSNSRSMFMVMDLICVNKHLAKIIF